MILEFDAVADLMLPVLVRYRPNFLNPHRMQTGLAFPFTRYPLKFPKEDVDVTTVLLKAASPRVARTSLCRNLISSAGRVKTTRLLRGIPFTGQLAAGT